MPVTSTTSPAWNTSPDPHVLSDLEPGILADGNFPQHTEGALEDFATWPRIAFDTRWAFLCAEPELHRCIVVARRSLRLHDGARTRLHDRHGHEAALAREDLGHADLLADDPAHHDRAAVPLLQLDFDVDAGREVQLAESVDRLLCRLEDVEETLVRPELELLPRLLVHVRRAVHGETLDVSRERNRTGDATAGAADRVDDLAHRLIEQPVIVTPKAYADLSRSHAIPGSS
jgi:hypothetical protein